MIKSKHLPIIVTTLLLTIISPLFLMKQASAREFHENCGERIRTVRENVYIPKESDGSGINGATRIISQRKVKEYTCPGEQTLSAVVGFDNSGTGFGIDYYNRVSRYIGGRASYFLKDGNSAAALALTTQIDLGSAADLFLGGGYYYTISGSANKNYPFLTTGIDFRLTPQLDLNATVRVPIGGDSSSGISYSIGTGIHFGGAQ